MPGNVFQKSDVFIMHSDLCKKIIPTAHINDEMIQLQRVCTLSSCLPMIAYLTSALKNVRVRGIFFFSFYCCLGKQAFSKIYLYYKG